MATSTKAVDDTVDNNTDANNVNQEEEEENNSDDFVKMTPAQKKLFELRLKMVSYNPTKRCGYTQAVMTWLTFTE